MFCFRLIQQSVLLSLSVRSEIVWCRRFRIRDPAAKLRFTNACKGWNQSWLVLGGSEKERKGGGGDATATQWRAMSVSARARGQLELSHAHSAYCRLNGEHSNAHTEDLDVDHDEVAEKFWVSNKFYFFYLWFCRTWSKRYLITSQTRVKRVSRIHHRTILIGLAVRNRLLLSFSSSSYFLSFSIQKKFYIACWLPFCLFGRVPGSGWESRLASS